MSKSSKKTRENDKQEAVRSRIEALFLKNIGRVVNRRQIMEAAGINPKTGEPVENWHQRLSELRTDYGYTILSRRDTRELKVSEYLMPTAYKRPDAAKRVKISPETWRRVLEHADHRCGWDEDGTACGLRSGEKDPIGGGTVRLTPDHKKPHAMSPNADPGDPNDWQALCGRHQVMKKNYWDHSTGKLNVVAIVQSAGEETKRDVYTFLKTYFGQ